LLIHQRLLPIVSIPHSLPLESAPQLGKKRLSLRSYWTAEVEEDLESGGSRLIEELKTASGGAVHVSGLYHGEHSGQLLPADVHVERIGLDIEELAGRAEAAELSINLNRRSAVRHQYTHWTQSLQTPKQLVPSGNFEFCNPIRWKCSDNFDLWHTKITSQL
jgi:hypothetical protein